jgi:hypothetical protein
MEYASSGYFGRIGLCSQTHSILQWRSSRHLSGRKQIGPSETPMMWINSASQPILPSHDWLIDSLVFFFLGVVYNLLLQLRTFYTSNYFCMECRIITGCLSFWFWDLNLDCTDWKLASAGSFKRCCLRTVWLNYPTLSKVIFDSQP